VLSRDVSETVLPRADETPDGVVPAQRPCGHDFAESDFVALLDDFQIGALVDSEGTRISDGIVTCPLDVNFTTFMGLFLLT
jgi:hypothetical protein